MKNDIFKFKIGNETWSIHIKDSNALQDEYEMLCKVTKKEYNENSYRLGFCNFLQQQIVLNSMLCKEAMIRTLKHELTHCWLYVNGHNEELYDEEQICNFITPLSAFINLMIDGFIHEMEKRHEEIEN